jgi:8-oxo-dGTP pyrophosphatase MutT (NUDIX family)
LQNQLCLFQRPFSSVHRVTVRPVFQLPVLPGPVAERIPTAPAGPGAGKVKVWKKNVVRSGCAIKALEPLQLIYKSNNELLFALCKSDVTAPHGGKLPRIVVIRGDVVVIVPLVKNRDTGEERFITVVQYRIGNGTAGIEFPAGMIDRNIDDPAGVAVEEFHEETGVRIAASDLFPLSERLLYTSPGLQDEGINYFGCELEMADEEFRRLEGRKTGEPSEGEAIVVSLKTAEEIERLTNGAQVLLGLFLFDRRRNEAGRVKEKPAKHL